MEMQDKYVIGDKEYTREELLVFGKAHYPKFYWITRGLGLGFVSIGLTYGLIYLLILIVMKFQNDIMKTYWYIQLVPCFVLLLAGLILIPISFMKRPDEDYIKHAYDCFAKAALRQKLRDKRIEERNEAKTINQILKYKKLLDAGVITQEEYDAKKKELIG